jgi:methionyl-tRNA formyltransferase
MGGSIIIAAVKPWTRVYAERFRDANPQIEAHILTRRGDLTLDTLNGARPRYVFFPHWSWRIPREIYENCVCVVFHPADVPFGRGGTPIQNLIARGFTETVISAIQANGEIDGGDVLAKRPLSLLGGGEEILMRMQRVIFEDMIPFILGGDIIPAPQSGEAFVFKRRTPEMSELRPDMTVTQIFDAVRMLDIEGYPKAFIRFGD